VRTHRKRRPEELTAGRVKRRREPFPSVAVRPDPNLKREERQELHRFCRWLQVVRVVDRKDTELRPVPPAGREERRGVSWDLPKGEKEFVRPARRRRERERKNTAKISGRAAAVPFGSTWWG